MDVIKEQLAKLRKEGKTPSIGDVTPVAKKEWAEIKAGKHPLYTQGTSKGKKGNKTHKQGNHKQGKGKQSKGKQGNHKQSNKTHKQGNHKQGNKTHKQGKGKQGNNNTDSSTTPHPMCIQQMLTKVHLCKKDVNKIHKYLKTLKTQTGGDCGCQTGGGSGGGCGCQDGGKKKRKTKKNMKGGSSKAGESAEEPFESMIDSKTGLEDDPEETDGTKEEELIVENI